MDAARLRTDLPGFASGFNIHQDDLPVPSFCTLINRLCSDKLWRMEFYNEMSSSWKIIVDDVYKKNQFYASCHENSWLNNFFLRLFRENNFFIASFDGESERERREKLWIEIGACQKSWWLQLSLCLCSSVAEAAATKINQWCVNKFNTMRTIFQQTPH